MNDELSKTVPYVPMTLKSSPRATPYPPGDFSLDEMLQQSTDVHNLKAISVQIDVEVRCYAFVRALLDVSLKQFETFHSDLGYKGEPVLRSSIDLSNYQSSISVLPTQHSRRERCQTEGACICDAGFDD
jgi:hypothetical protein